MELVSTFLFNLNGVDTYPNKYPQKIHFQFFFQVYICFQLSDPWLNIR